MSCTTRLSTFLGLSINILGNLILVEETLKLLYTFTILFEIVVIAIETKWIRTVSTNFTVSLLGTNLRSVRFYLAPFIYSKFF